MDRRTFLGETGGVWLAFVCGAWRASCEVPGAAPGCAVFDPTLVEGRTLAHCAQQAGIDAWPATDDIGMFWHMQLARRVGERTQLISALRPADTFVLARLAAARGVVLFAPGAGQAEACLRISSSRNSRRRILPTLVCGSVSRNSTSRGTL
jgi:hypothetical protein